MRAHYFYLARCGDGSLYAGATGNLLERERRHNEGRGGRYTRSRLPVKIVYSEGFATRGEALKREAEVKTWPNERKEALVQRAAP